MNLSQTPSRRSAERFARLVDLELPPAFLDGGDPAMRPAIVLTAALRSAGRAAGPAPLSQTARLSMRRNLVAAAAAGGVTVPIAIPARTAGVATVATAASREWQRARLAGRRFSRRIAAVVGSVVIVTSVAGVGVAAARSLPGDPFYGLKRATEAVQLWAASGPVDKGELHLEFARTRLAEADALGAASSHLSSTLRDMNAETRAGSSDLISAYRQTGATQPLTDIVSFVATQFPAVMRLGTTLPATLRPQATYSLQLLAGVADAVRSVSGRTCLACLLPGGSPTPRVIGRSPTPAPGASGSVTPSSGATSTPSGVLPTGVVPTQLPTKVPTSLPTQLPTSVPTLAGLPHHHNGTSAPTHAPNPLLSSLRRLIG